MEEYPNQAPEIEPPDGMYPSRMDDRGRIKLPVAFKEYLEKFENKRLFVTSLDRRIAQIYPMAIWRDNEKVFESFRDNPRVAKSVAFNAADLGAETEMDGQGRILLSPELRRELGIENAPVRLFAYRGHIEIMSEKIYEARKLQAAELTEEDFSKLEAAGLN